MSDRASSRWMSSRLPAYARSAFTTTVRGPDVKDTLRSAIERMASIVSGSVDDGGELRRGRGREQRKETRGVQLALLHQNVGLGDLPRQQRPQARGHDEPLDQQRTRRADRDLSRA